MFIERSQNHRGAFDTCLMSALSAVGHTEHMCIFGSCTFRTAWEMAAATSGRGGGGGGC